MLRELFNSLGKLMGLFRHSADPKIQNLQSREMQQRILQARKNYGYRFQSQTGEGNQASKPARRSSSTQRAVRTGARTSRHTGPARTTGYPARPISSTASFTQKIYRKSPYTPSTQTPYHPDTQVVDYLLVFTSIILISLIAVFLKPNLLGNLFPNSPAFSFDLPLEVEAVPLTAGSKIQPEPDASPQTEEASIFQKFDKLLPFYAPKEKTETAKDIELFRDIRNYSESRNSSLFFVKVLADNSLKLKTSLRKIYYREAPMTRTLEELLAGPTPQEINNGLYSMIPNTTELLDARIEGEVAYLNFSPDLLGKVELPEILRAAVQQIVFSVTEFPNIKRARILVEGQPITADLLRKLKPDAPALMESFNWNRELERKDFWR